jgi:FkbM family methyltransferase
VDKWFDWIIARFFELVHVVEHDNFDATRYGHPQDVFNFDFHVDSFLFFDTHRSNLFVARSLLADQQSRDIFDSLILFRILGHRHVRLPFNTSEHRGDEERVNKWRTGGTDYRCVIGPLSTFRVPLPDGDVRVNCCPGNVAAHALFNQYHLQRDGICITPERGHVVIDAGACFGDTALFFASEVGASGHVHAFEPMPKHCEIIRGNLAMNSQLGNRVTLHPFGIFDRTIDVTAAREDIEPGVRLNDTLPARPLDSFGIEHVDFIKMDVEGSELAALCGSARTLKRDKPKLAISLYHQFEDFFTIPQWIASMELGYSLYLDHYSIHHEETVLYATV